MKATREWAKGKSPIIEIFATQIISSAHEVHKAFGHIKDRKLYDHHFPLPDLSSWFSLYHSTNPVSSFFHSLISEFSAFDNDQIELGLEFYTVFTNWDKIDKRIVGKITQADVDQAAKSVRGLIDVSYVDIQNDISPGQVDPDEKKAFLQLLGQYENEAAFFFLVYAPCWLLYQLSPNELYSRASRGDVDALEMLLRLDSLMIHDPIIGFQVQQLRFNHRKSVYSELLDAVQRNPKKKITRKRIKYLLAGLVSVVAEQLKQPLSDSDIQSLFDRIAKDAKRGNQDDDFLIEPGSFSKAIQRNRGFWLDAIKQDTKK